MAAPVIDIPLYEPALFGNPFYMWIIMGLMGLMIIGIVAFKTEVYDIMKPVWGFRDSASSGKPQMIVRGMNGKMWLESVDHVANIFRSMTLPLMWIITVPVAGQMGKVNTSIVSDDWNIVHDLDIDYAMVDIAHAWNELQDTTFANEEERQYVYDWNTFSARLMNGDFDKLFPNGVTLPPFRVVNLHEIRRYLPKWDAAHHAGYINQEVANRRKDEDKKGTELIKYAIVAGAVLVICCVLGWLIISNARPVNCG